MDAQALVQKLQIILGLELRTGQITLNLKDGQLESFETRTYGRLKARDVVKGLDARTGCAQTT